MKHRTNLIGGVINGFFIGIILIFAISRFQSPQFISNLVEASDDTRKIQLDSPAPDFG